MAEAQRYALVTGANKGIGFQICRQLACKGIMVILASRNERRGVEARERLVKESNVSEKSVVFHQLDVVDPASVAAVSEFIESRFGRLDILVNNAAINGIDVEGDALAFQEYLEADFSFQAGFCLDQAGGGKKEEVHPKANGRIVETFEGVKECVETNYYGAKRVTQALLPLLQKSHSPRIVNISSSMSSSSLQHEWAEGVFSSEESSEEDLEEVLQEYLKDFKEAKLQEKLWPHRFSAYKLSKKALNAYTRIMAKRNPNFCINCVCPGFARTDIACNFGLLSEAEAAEAPVKLALLPDGGPSGCFYTRDQALSLC